MYLRTSEKVELFTREFPGSFMKQTVMWDDLSNK